MAAAPVIDTSWHPLADGMPPDWASGWGQDRYGVFVEFTIDDVTQRLRWIMPGRFTMGSPPPDEPDRSNWEGPQYEVTIARGFWLFDTPCTQALWSAVMGGNPSKVPGAERPVERVSWDEVQDFLGRLNDRVPGLDLSLPSEAQWEYACRADGKPADRDAIAWYGANSGGEPHPVATKRPNAWGLYDMLGNVWEWCADTWHDSYDGAPADGSAWTAPGEQNVERVARGGSWSSTARFLRVAYRRGLHPDGRFGNLGFRCARVQP